MDEKNFDFFGNSAVFYTCFFDVKLPEDYPNKIETSRSISGLYVEAYLYQHICVLVGVMY